MQYIEAFSQDHKNQMDEGDNPLSSIFLAGGISNCQNWQSEVVGSLVDFNITVVNQGVVV